MREEGREKGKGGFETEGKRKGNGRVTREKHTGKYKYIQVNTSHLGNFNGCK